MQEYTTVPEGSTIEHSTVQELHVIGIENGALLVASDAGERFRIGIDGVLQSGLRQTRVDIRDEQRVPPREIQAHIRSGLSAEQVAELTGAALEYVQRFEGPILAERKHIVETALRVLVHTAIDPDPIDDGVTFREVIRERLTSLKASGEQWSSWKDAEDGWIIKLAFTVDDVDHDARWNFVPKKNALNPLNVEAITLSRQGEAPTTLVPRLRAVGTGEAPDHSRFDSGAFTVKTENNADGKPEFRVEPTPLTPGRNGLPSINAHAVTAINRSVDESSDVDQTADLLEALRRRRGERESIHNEKEQSDKLASSIQHALDTHSDTLEAPDENPIMASTPPIAPQKSARKGRASMPSWDEIVFGARTDGDLA